MCPAPKQLDNIKHNKKKKKTHTQCRVSSLSTPHNQTNKKFQKRKNLSPFSFPKLPIFHGRSVFSFFHQCLLSAFSNFMVVFFSKYGRGLFFCFFRIRTTKGPKIFYEIIIYLFLLLQCFSFAVIHQSFKIRDILAIFGNVTPWSVFFCDSIPGVYQHSRTRQIVSGARQRYLGLNNKVT